jgi:hypothetical protein
MATRTRILAGGFAIGAAALLTGTAAHAAPLSSAQAGARVSAASPAGNGGGNGGYGHDHGKGGNGKGGHGKGGHGSPSPKPTPPCTPSPTPSSPAPSSPAPSSPASSGPPSAPVSSASPPSVGQAGPVAISPAANGPAAPHVAAFLSRYFQAINAKDYPAYRSMYDPTSNPAQSEAGFLSGYRTTQDYAITLVRLIPSGAGGWLATVTFTSNQAPSASPTGTPCTRWRVLYVLAPAGATFVLEHVPPGYHAAAQSCPS